MSDPTKPGDWIRRARSNLARATTQPGSPDVLLADLCVDARQAAEKALKALLVHLQVPFPKTHSLPELVRLLEQAGERPPEQVRRAGGLTKYAVEARYPGFGDDVDEKEWRAAVSEARDVVAWVERRLEEAGVTVRQGLPPRRRERDET